MTMMTYRRSSHTDGCLDDTKSIDGKYGSRDECIRHRSNQPTCGKSTSNATAVCGICNNAQYNISASNANPTTHAAIQHPEFWNVPACRIGSWWKARRTGCTPFANFMGRGGQGGLPHIGGGRGGGVATFTQQNAPRNAAPMYSNIIKWYANWNICFSCGFDVEDGHRSKTCPPPGDTQITKKDILALTLGNIFQWDMMHAPRRCTSCSYPPCDGVGQNS